MGKYQEIYAQMEAADKAARKHKPSAEYMAVKKSMHMMAMLEERPIRDNKHRMEIEMAELEFCCNAYMEGKGNVRTRGIGKAHLDAVQSVSNLLVRDRETLANQDPQLDGVKLADALEGGRKQDPHREPVDKLFDDLNASRRTSRGKTLNNSPEYTSILKNLKTINEISKEPVTIENSLKMQKANRELGEACNGYMERHSGIQWNKISRERLAMVKELSELQKKDEKGIQKMRQASEVRKAQHGDVPKKWGAVLAESRVDNMELTKEQQENIKTVGANLNSRIDLRPFGKDGFFTADTHTDNMEDAKEKIFAGQPKVYQDALRNCALFNQDLEQTSSWVRGAKTDIQSETKENFIAFMGNSLADTPRLNTDEGKDLVWKVAQEMDSARAKDITSKGAFIDDGADIGKRNIATSRMASLVGLDHLIAHSDRMTLTIDGVQQSGIFMNLAKGVDSSLKKHEQAFAKIAMLETKELQRQTTSLEVLDLICGQCDRHSGNMLYNLKTIGGGGGLKVAGVQGIDNDLAWGAGLIDLNQNHGDSRVFMTKYTPLPDISHVDASLAQQIASLDRAHLEYALGDVLQPNEIDAAWQRTQQLQQHLAKVEVKKMERDDWNNESAQKLREHRGYYKKACSECLDRKNNYCEKNPNFQQPEKVKPDWEMQKPMRERIDLKELEGPKPEVKQRRPQQAQLKPEKVLQQQAPQK